MPEPNACLVCDPPDLAEIDAALDADEGLNATARRFGLSRGAVQRHTKHRDAKPGKAPAAEAPPEPTPEPFEPSPIRTARGPSRALARVSSGV